MLGAILAEHALNGLYTPSLNPDAYGQDEGGNIVDKNGKIVPLYSQPNVFQRLVSPTAQNYAAMNAQEAAMPRLAGQEAAIKKHTWQQNVYNPNASQFGGMSPDEAYSSYLVSPDTINEALRGRALNATGAPTQVGGMQGQSDIATATKNWQQALSELQNNPLEIANRRQALVNELHRSTGLDPVALDNMIKEQEGQHKRLPTELETKEIGANIQNAQAKTEQNILPLTTGAAVNNAVKGLTESSRIAPMPYFTSRVSPDWTVSAPTHDPLGMSPTQIMYQSMMQGGLNGQGAGSTTQPIGTLSSGRQFSVQQPATETPIIPQGAFQPIKSEDEQQKDADTQNQIEDAQHAASKAELKRQMVELEANKAKNDHAKLVGKTNADVLNRYIKSIPPDALQRIMANTQTEQQAQDDNALKSYWNPVIQRSTIGRTF